MGLAYMDVSDDARLASAVEKNKQSLLGKRLSIASISRLKISGTADKRRSNAGETAETSKGRRGPQPQSASQGRGDNVQLIGKNTFATPRNVRALAFPSRNKVQSERK